MVLCSEFAAVWVTHIAISILFIEKFQGFLRSFYGRRISVCGMAEGSLPAAYVAVRLLLEKESRASVGTIFYTVLVVLLSDTWSGNWSFNDWMIRMASSFGTFFTIFLYLIFDGLDDVAAQAELVQLDLDLKWYHIILMSFSSYRWLILSLLITSSIFSKAVENESSFKVISASVAFFRIATMWIVIKLTGTDSAHGPWGILDRVLLEHTNLLNLTLYIETFNMILDQVSIQLRKKDELEYDWEEFTTLLLGGNQSIQEYETHQLDRNENTPLV